MGKTFKLATAAGALAAVILGLLIAPTASAEAPSVSLSFLEAGVGQEGTVHLDAHNIADPGLGAWTVDIVYDPNVLTPVGCEAHNFGLCNTAYDEATVRVAGINVLGLDGEVDLATVTFSCKRVGESALAIGLSVFADATPGGPRTIDAETDDGVAVCSEDPVDPTPAANRSGDVNCDGITDVIDATMILQYDASLINSLPCEENGDVTGDGVVNAADAAVLLQGDAGFLG